MRCFIKKDSSSISYSVNAAYYSTLFQNHSIDEYAKGSGKFCKAEISVYSSISHFPKLCDQNTSPLSIISIDYPQGIVFLRRHVVKSYFNGIQPENWRLDWIWGNSYGLYIKLKDNSSHCTCKSVLCNVISNDLDCRYKQGCSLNSLLSSIRTTFTSMLFKGICFYLRYLDNLSTQNPYKKGRRKRKGPI